MRRTNQTSIYSYFDFFPKYKTIPRRIVGGDIANVAKGLEEVHGIILSKNNPPTVYEKWGN